MVPKKVIYVPQDQKALHLFRTLTQENKESDEKLLYLLTLYLERRKHVVKRGDIYPKQQKNGGIKLYELEETGEVFPVRMCSISLKETEAMLAEIALSLNTNE